MRVCVPFFRKLLSVFFKNRLNQNEILILAEAERSLKIPLVETCRWLSGKKRKKFLANAEYYNKCHKEYLAAKERFSE